MFVVENLNCTGKPKKERNPPPHNIINILVTVLLDTLLGLNMYITINFHTCNSIVCVMFYWPFLGSEWYTVLLFYVLNDIMIFDSEMTFHCTELWIFYFGKQQSVHRRLQKKKVQKDFVYASPNSLQSPPPPFICCLFVPSWNLLFSCCLLDRIDPGPAVPPTPGGSSFLHFLWSSLTSSLVGFPVPYVVFHDLLPCSLGAYPPAAFWERVCALKYLVNLGWPFIFESAALTLNCLVELLTGKTSPSWAFHWGAPKHL